MNLPVPHIPSWPTIKQRALAVPLWKWGVGAAVGGVLLILIFGRRKVGDMIGGAWDAAKDQAFVEVTGNLWDLTKDLPEGYRLRSIDADLANTILIAADRYGVSPLAIYAIGQNETRWGQAGLAGGYRDDTGDWTARPVGAPNHWESVPGTKIVTELPEHWSSGGTSGPWVIPGDELGWGRGITQLDFGRRAAGLDYHDPHAMIMATAKFLRQDYDALAVYLQNAQGWDPTEILYAALASYNRGLGGVKHNIENGLDAGAGTNPSGKYAELAFSAMKALSGHLG